jgi:hypothetical protein
MKKTTWVIIGLSICVVALSIALVLVITHKKTESIISTEADFSYEPSNIINVMVDPKPWLQTFSMASDYTKTKTYYYGYYGSYSELYSTSELDKKGDFLGERVPGIPYKVYTVKRPYQKRWHETKEEKK